MLFGVLGRKSVIESILIDFCPEYNTLDTVPCNVSSGCPDVLYLSNEVYKCKKKFLFKFIYNTNLHLVEYYQEPIKNTASRLTQKKKSMFLRSFVLFGLRSTNNVYL